VAAELGINIKVARSHFSQSNGMMVGDQLQELAISPAGKGKEIKPKRLKKSCNAFWDQVDKVPLELVDGAKECLEQLQQMNVVAAVSTSMPSRMAKNRIAELGLGDSVGYVIGADGGFPKGVGHIQALARHFRLDFDDFCQRAVLVGANAEDMLIAKNCREAVGNGHPFGIGVTGMAVASNWYLKNAGATHFIHSIGQLPEKITEIGV